MKPQPAAAMLMLMHELDLCWMVGEGLAIERRDDVRRADELKMKKKTPRSTYHHLILV